MMDCKRVVFHTFVYMGEKEQIIVIKKNGEETVYDAGKLRNSLSKAGASEAETHKVVEVVEANLFDKVPTSKIYQFAHSQLKKQKSLRAAGRFRLKDAVLKLGPSGYPFEIFVGKLFESFGFSTQVGIMVQGKCVKHEVDVVARRAGEMCIVETKFKGDFKGKTPVQVPLYIHSRFSDIRNKWAADHPNEELDIRGFVVTNTRFTLDAITYAECVGLQVISWDYPDGGSLKHFIDLSGLHPLTSLHSLKRFEQVKLMEQGIVLCNELESNQQLMIENGIAENRIKKILAEAELLITNP